MDEEDMMLLSLPPSTTASVCNLHYGGRAVNLEGPNGRIDRYSINDDNDDDEDTWMTCSFPGKSNDPQSDKKALRKLVMACVLCFTFMCAELVGGIIANSLAVITDAAHLLSDFIGFLISLSALCLARRRPSKRLTYGWFRAEIIGVLFSVELIWLVTGILVYLAIERIRSMNFHVEAKPMLITAAFGVFVNIVMGLILHQHIPHVGHGHSHYGTAREPSNGNGHGHSHQHANLNVRAAFIHCVGDLLQSVGVLIAAIVIWFKPEYKVTDPICTFVFSVLVIGTTVFIIRDTLNVLMESSPSSVDVAYIKGQLLAITGVVDCHNFHVWSLTTSKHVCSIHILINPSLISHEAAVRMCYEVLSSAGDFHNITIQLERCSNFPDS